MFILRLPIAKLLILVFVAFAAYGATASPRDELAAVSVSSLIAEADRQELSESRIWHALMHYHQPAMPLLPLVSYVDDEAFFYATNGKYDPRAELHATIAALFADPALGNEHAQCRFPARSSWLKVELKIPDSTLPAPVCKDYQDWREQVSASKLSLIFPSAYINSPSSMFGHTLFRFDPQNVEEGTDWLSWALSFGANINADDNSIMFAYRGIFGGYMGIYNMTHYFRKIKEYNDLENRDIWEYALDLTATDVAVILEHTWELKEMDFDYYFLDENCAFRLLELIELVREDVDLTSQFTMTAIPADTVRAVIDEGLVSEISFKPSATTRLKSRIAELTDTQSAIARSLADDISVLESPQYLALSPKDKARVLQVAFSFTRYRQLKMVRDEDIAERSHRLLLELNKQPNEEHVVVTPERPESGHKTTMAGVSAGIEDDKAYAQFDFRPTYHDLLDDPRGYPKGAHIAMGNTQLRLSEGGKATLERFDFIDIVSLSAIDHFFVSPSWHVKTGYEKVFAQSENGKGKDTGAYYVKAGGGAATELLDSVLVYAFADARIENNSYYKTFFNAAFGISGGALAYLPFGTLRASVDSDYFTNDEYRLKVALEQNIPLTVDDAIRVGVSKQWHRGYQQYEAAVSYRHYF